MESLLIWVAVGFVGGVFVGSFFEWSLHRFAMHKPFFGWRYPFKAHALVHHQKFRADESYHLQREEDLRTIPMAWWNGPAIVAVGLVPASFIAWLVGQWGIALGAGLAFAAYYGTYEYIHWCMHLPGNRRVERSGIYFRLNGHHLLHHRYMHKNFNVVFPLADLCLGTLLRRSPIAFAQARGSAVPDVQPSVGTVVGSKVVAFEQGGEEERETAAAAARTAASGK
jgi:hypothetical protein